MKIAVVDQTINKGGGSRVLRKLLPSFLKADDNIKIDLFANSAGLKREKFTEFKKKNLNIKELESLRFDNNEFFKKFKIDKLLHILRSRYPKLINFFSFKISGNLKAELEKKLVKYDIVYFPWPFLIECPRINIPIFATFHDFNFKYYFSASPIFSKKRSIFLNKEMPIWLRKATPIVSNNFIKKEIIKFYPKSKKKINVINLASYSEGAKTYSKRKKNYIICPTNLASHKNLGPLLVGFYFLSKKVKNIKLILTGPNTETIKGHATNIGVELSNKKPNVVGLGYVNNNNLEKLISESKVLVSSSLYEADNGPCTDGWYHGIPVVCSKIPSNFEHIKDQKVYAELFDPYNSQDIFKKLYKVIKNEKKYLKLSKLSRSNILNYTWDNAAYNYIKVFKENFNATKNFKTRT